ncbi:molybdopterin molybdotransferase MoeA [Aliikangiella sp. IMCC44653]
MQLKDNTNHLISLHQALRIIDQLELKPLAEQVCELDEIGHRVCAQTIYAKEDVPGFTNSAMDGFAVSSQSTLAASPDNPITLKVIGKSAAGDKALANSVTSKPNCTWQLMTGAQVPKGFDAVIPIEACELLISEKHSERVEKITITAPISATTNIRSAASDFKANQLLLNIGETINAPQLMAMAATGVSKASVFAKPKIAFIATGKEVIDDANLTLEPNQIRNSSKYYIKDWLSHLPIEFNDLGINKDDPEKFEKTLSDLSQSNTNLIISTGAVSMGEHDFIPKLISKLNGKILFHKVKIKPGKPILLAQLPSGVFYLGLPGNPISSVLGIRLFAYRLIAKWLQLKPEAWQSIKTNNAYQNHSDFHHILKAQCKLEDSQLRLQLMSGQESYKIQPILESTGWAIIPPKTNVNPDESIEYLQQIPN